MMTANEIRTRFLEFFASKGHTVVPSDSVVPKDDPTVLFTTAGMQQFKRQFLGQNVTYKRAASSQKCLRTDDLDKVGKTAFHHTFFEMLGNFSFGDYFKKDAIAWAWEFLTKEMKIPATNLWVSVYTEDDEAYDIWLKDIKVPKERIVKLGDKSNFWPSEAKTKGPNGPCGPCSEIFYDYGVNKNCPQGNKCDPDCSCGRFSEVWNLVFTQFNRKDGGTLEPLPGKNIDTGMGFERLIAVVQGKKNNYETDLFAPILSMIDAETKKMNCHLAPAERLLVADHIRAIVFGICDGVMPSNEGRGYVIKRLIIGATDLVLHGGAKESIIFKLVPSVVSAMNEPYPELLEKQTDFISIIRKIEEAYIKTRTERIPELKRELENAESSQALGEIIFKYRDTFGLTLETIRDVLKSLKNLLGDERGASDSTTIEVYEQLMEEQKSRSRAASKMTGDVFADADLNLNVPKTEFVGYTDLKSTGKILKMFIANKDVGEAKKGDSIKLILDKTPFYAESGGQIGDTGVITNGNAKIRVSDTKKIADSLSHTGEVGEGHFRIGDAVTSQIDEARRLSIMRNHTATHLLQSALRKTLGTHVQQQGSHVAEDRLRFDFTHPQAVKKEQLSAIESLINSFISSNDSVEKHVMTLQEAKKSGALAFFAEKYGDTVRVVTVDGYSKEFCGGTHLNKTGEIKAFKITSEGAIAQGIRRIEAVTGDYVKDWLKGKEAEEKARQESKRKRQSEKELMEINFIKIKSSINEIIKNADTIDNTKIVTYTFANSDANQLKQVYDIIKQQVPSVAVCVGTAFDSGTAVVVGVSGDLIERGIKANEIIKEINPVINGSGGGRPELAQAGGKDPSKLDAAVQKAKEILKKAISK